MVRKVLGRRSHASTTGWQKVEVGRPRYLWHQLMLLSVSRACNASGWFRSLSPLALVSRGLATAAAPSSTMSMKM